MRSVLVLFILVYISHVYLADRSEVNWNTKEGDTLPILEIHFQDEIFSIPLREAPFCRLVITHNCDCFMLRKDYNGSNWIMGSFAYCNGAVIGNFMNITDYFEMEPLGNGTSREYNVTKFPPGIELPNQIFDNIRGDTYEPTDDSLYFHPFAESGLEDYQTAYIPCLFVIDVDTFNEVRTDQMDIYLQAMINEANELFSEFNIVVVYKGWKTTEIEKTNEAINRTVYNFLEGDFKNFIFDIEGQILVILFTPKTIIEDDGSATRGLAGRHTICRPSLGIYVSYAFRTEKYYWRTQYTTFVHEIGHTLGMIHIKDTECRFLDQSGKIWIMEDYISYGEGTLDWSPCSKDLVKKRRSSYFCLREKPKPPKPSCGNGVLEKGEQCECVGKACSKCCDDKCQLTKGSSCASGPCCDMKTCKPRLANDTYTCRRAKDVCDLPEMCNGTSHKCPANYVVANGYGCGKSYSQGGYCYNGLCGSRQDVCSWVYTDGSIGEEKCYKNNEQNGSSWSGCGPTFGDPRFGKIDYFGCKGEDIFCGKVSCVYSPNASITFDFKATYFTRRISYVHLPGCLYLRLKESTRFLREDPTFVQNGSACGIDDKKMCLRQTCVPLPSGCPENCSGEQRAHPETGENFPVFILPEPEYESHRDENGNGPEGSSLLHWFLILLSIICLIVLGSLILYKRLSKQRPEETDAPSQPESPPAQR